MTEEQANKLLALLQQMVSQLQWIHNAIQNIQNK